MADIVHMPKLGFDMAEGTLVRWVKAEGEQVQKGEVLAEIETDKATVEVDSNFTGVMLRQIVEQGAVVPVGVPIAVIGEPGETYEIPGEQPAAAEKPAAAPATPAPAAPAAAPAAPAATPAAPAAAPAPAEATGLPGGVRATPLARRMADEHGLDLSAVPGSGPGGRIVRRDIEAALQAAPAPAPTPAGPRPLPIPAVPVALGAVQAPPDEVVALSRLRIAIGRRLAESKQQLPHFYVTHVYDLEGLDKLRKEVNAYLPENERITVNDFIVKAAGMALRQFPNLNAVFQGDKVVRMGHVNVGIAVPVEGGLLTVVTRDTDQKPLRLLSQEVREMVARARSGKVRPDDIEGSTFSTSNLGMYDVEEFVAIINPPEAAILAVGTAKKVPVVDPETGEIKVGLRMKATLSVDHRVSDGAEAAQFMQALGVFLEKPTLLLL